MDWRAGVFSNKVIMTVMNKYLALRDVGVITALCEWSVDWRETMTTVLNMRNRIAQRWPYGLYYTPEEGRDVITLLQKKARQALLPVRTLRFVCWMGGYSGCCSVSRVQLANQEAMPYASCLNCTRAMAPRHMISTHLPQYYISARLTNIFRKYAGVSSFRKHSADRFVRYYVQRFVDPKTIVWNTIASNTSPQLCAELDVYFMKLVREHDLHDAWDEFCVENLNIKAK